LNKQNTNADKKRLLSLLAATGVGLMCAGPVMAQGNGTQGGGTTASSGSDTSSASGNDGRTGRGSDYGWLGLLGLVGLAGLRKQPTAVRQDTEYQPTGR